MFPRPFPYSVPAMYGPPGAPLDAQLKSWVEKQRPSVEIVVDMVGRLESALTTSNCTPEEWTALRVKRASSLADILRTLSHQANSSESQAPLKDWLRVSESDSVDPMLEVEARQLEETKNRNVLKAFKLLRRGPLPRQIGVIDPALPRIISPSLTKVLQEKDFASLSSLIKQEGHGVFTFDCLDATRTNDLIEEAFHLFHYSNNTKNGLVSGSVAFYQDFLKPTPGRLEPGLEGVIFNNFPIAKAFIQALVKQVIEPVGLSYLSKDEALGQRRKHRWLEPTYAHVVSYTMYSGVQGHFPHVDDSDITINICLGKQFIGGELVLTDGAGEQIILPQTPGRAIVHNGHLLHESKEITYGERYNLIIWCNYHESDLETFEEFTQLPAELQQMVIDKLEPRDLCQMRLVSQAMYQAVEHSTRWAEEAKASSFIRDSDDQRTWRKLFMDNCAQHREALLKGWTPMDTLISTRFYGPPPDPSTFHRPSPYPYFPHGVPMKAMGLPGYGYPPQYPSPYVPMPMPPPPMTRTAAPPPITLPTHVPTRMAMPPPPITRTATPLPPAAIPSPGYPYHPYPTMPPPPMTRSAAYPPPFLAPPVPDPQPQRKPRASPTACLVQ